MQKQLSQNPNRKFSQPSIKDCPNDKMDRFHNPSIGERHANPKREGFTTLHQNTAQARTAHAKPQSFWSKKLTQTEPDTKAPGLIKTERETLLKVTFHDPPHHTNQPAKHTINYKDPNFISQNFNFIFFTPPQAHNPHRHSPSMHLHRLLSLGGTGNGLEVPADGWRRSPA
jgi:hypothetical protein